LFIRRKTNIGKRKKRAIFFLSCENVLKSGQNPEQGGLDNGKAMGAEGEPTWEAGCAAQATFS
jgi:hypothetical protein